MVRSFVRGLAWGFVFVGGGLCIISQMAPMPKRTMAAASQTSAPAIAAATDSMALTVTPPAKVTSAAPEPADAGTVKPTPDPAAPKPQGTAGTAPAETGEAGGGQTSYDAGRTPPAPSAESAAKTGEAPVEVSSEGAAPVAGLAPGSIAPLAPDAPVVAPKPDQTAAPNLTAPDATAKPAPEPTLDPAPGSGAEPAPQPEAPPTSGGALATSPEATPPAAPAATEAPPVLDALGAALAAPAADQQPSAAEVPAPEPLGPKDSLLVPGQGAGLTGPSRLPQIAQAEDPGLVPAPLPQIAPPGPGDAAPAPEQSVAPHILQHGAPAMPGTKALATLPAVGKPAELPGVMANSLPQIGATPAPDHANEPPAADGPLVKYARAFDAKGKPRFAILLKDVGGAGMDRAALAKLPFPVTFVVDPLATDAKLAAETYRAAGQEVLMVANGLPPGANASDVAETFQTLEGILPEAVGVIDEDTLGFQDNRALATIVLPVIADQGRGLVTYDRGLNAADQIARRDGLSSAVVFRRLDGAGESQSTIRRYLDRAVFKASQMGSVVVLGDTRSDTVAAILQWTLEGKASTVDLAPITAVMTAE